MVPWARSKEGQCIGARLPSAIGPPFCFFPNRPAPLVDLLWEPSVFTLKHSACVYTLLLYNHQRDSICDDFSLTLIWRLIYCKDIVCFCSQVKAILYVYIFTYSYHQHYTICDDVPSTLIGRVTCCENCTYIYIYIYLPTNHCALQGPWTQHTGKRPIIWTSLKGPLMHGAWTPLIGCWDPHNLKMDLRSVDTCKIYCIHVLLHCLQFLSKPAWWRFMRTETSRFCLAFTEICSFWIFWYWAKIKLLVIIPS